MKVLILFFVLCVYGIMGHSVNFEIKKTAIEEKKIASCVLVNNVHKEITVYEGETVRVDVGGQDHIQKNECDVARTDGTSAVMKSTILNNDRNKEPFFLEKKATKDMAGVWTCKLSFGGPEGCYNDVNPIEDGYTSVVCQINVMVKAIDYKILPFTVTAPSAEPSCFHDQIGELRNLDKFRIVVTTNKNTPVVGGRCYICDKGICDDRRRLPSFTDLEPVTTGNKTVLTSEILQFNQANMNRKTLVCYVGLYINRNSDVNQTITLNLNNYRRADCLMELNPVAANISPIIWWVAGVAVLIIIVGQSIALLSCHIKAKARERDNLEDLKPRRRPLDRSDGARYSAAPSLRTGRPSRTAADTDSHIYEMVGVNALYKDSSEMEIIEMDIKNRPQLPLPGEFPDPAPPVHIETLPRPTKKPASMASTLSLDRNSSSTQMTAAKPSKNLPKPGPTPSRPPKPDEKSLPGSLQRPPKPVPKTGSVPKTIVKDPGLVELKNALKKRNPGMAPPNSSPVTTMEKKLPPHATKNPPPKQIVLPMPKPQPNPPLPPIKPGSAPSQIKAKLEATLKPITPMGKPQASDAVCPDFHVRPNPAGVSAVGPSSLSPARPNTSLVRPNLPVASVLPVTAGSPPVKKQLSAPHVASRLLPPIHQEDLGSDDEEWVYEPLEQYNLYNV